MSIPVSTALETASCSGARASVGSSAACAGLIAVEAIVNTAASAEHERERRADADRTAISARHARPHERRLHHHVAARAAVAPAGSSTGAANAAGSIRTSAATPTADAPPTSYA